jgi:hypothetical protein
VRSRRRIRRHGVQVILTNQNHKLLSVEDASPDRP